MAEGGIRQRSFTDSISKASGEANEIFCNPCMRSDKRIAVEGYCQVCDEFMCETCLNVHKQLKFTLAHPVLDKTRMPRAQTQSSIQDVCADVCKTHHPEIIRFHQALKSELQQMLDNLHDSQANIKSIFDNTKLAKRLVAMETEIQKMQQLQHHLYEFQISDEFSKMMSNKTPSGVLSVTIDTTATYKKSINVKSPTDNERCGIVDSAVLSPDRMVVIDKANRNIKLIDLDTDRDTVISTYTPPGKPGLPKRVAALSINMIAVTLHDVRKIQLLNVTSEFTVEREIKVKKQCRGISYKDDKLAVSYYSPGRVDIMDTKGDVLHTIKPMKDEQNILEWPAYIVFGHENDTVVISDYNSNTVYVVTFGGQILRSYNHHALKDPQGMVLIGDGLLYVCSRKNRCIHVVSPDFKTSKIIINDDNHVEVPRSISYCDITHALYISKCPNYGSANERWNQIEVYKLNV